MSQRANRIRRYQTSGQDVRTYYPVAIIGGGVAGIAMACRLKEKLGFDQFRVFESSGGIGGTWWSQQYPGVAADVLEHDTTSWEGNPSLSTPEVLKASWDESHKEWELTLGHVSPDSEELTGRQKQEKINSTGFEAVYWRAEVIRAKIVISAIGLLVEPNQWPAGLVGIERFAGSVLHSARWDAQSDLRDKDVIVVGTGSSAAQIVPELIKESTGVKSVTQVMRTPPWVSPYIQPSTIRLYERYGPWLMRNIPGLERILRLTIFLRLEFDYFSIIADGWLARWMRPRVESQLLKHLYSTAPQKYHDILTPNYGVGCKRRVFDVNWLQALHHPSVTLTTRPLQSVQAHSVTLGGLDKSSHTIEGSQMDSSGDVTIPADVIILATGYQASTWAHLPEIQGREGKRLKDLWRERGSPQAYLGTAIDKFPNFFMLFGPNTAVGHSSAILAIENGVNYAIFFMSQILDGVVHTVEVKEDAARTWAAKVQEAHRSTVLVTGGCDSWYMSENGANPTIYP
ncbi:Hypothetical protein PENO1_073290 [Penicillium occitanis (nom. inval.)]|nr:Hypothetical protein PENO1_073290 [Penicillium occitanis (nom. inval.)]PCG95619.1 hypothetical protein PENOC_076760 [Penicillium occitanis (nom. inval.)]